MNGAESLLKTLIDSGVDVCFANPGTSEMQLVAAFDKIPGMRPILGLFEGVVTGAADGYGRMADKPAATLLHLGSGFSNSMANLHNAKRAFTPIINLVGDHALYHLPLDAPLTSDVPGHAALVSEWSRVSKDAKSLAGDGADAVVAAMAGRPVNLIVPADFAWTEDCEPAAPRVIEKPLPASQESINEAVKALQSNESTCLMIGAKALREEGLIAAQRLAEKTGVKVITTTFPARMERGRGRPTFGRLPYFGEMAADVLKDFKNIILVGLKPPVSFFAYPGKPSKLWPEDCNLIQAGDQFSDQITTLELMANLVDAPTKVTIVDPPLPEIPKDGSFSAESIGAVVVNLLPENAIVSDETNTSGAFTYEYFDAAAQHDWMTLTGGAIGQGLPLSIGAAVACPDRKVINLQGDGSAMYTNQSLWTMARENLDVCVVIYNNSKYAILNVELGRVGVKNPRESALSMLDISNPIIDWVKMSESMGVPATRATTTEEFQEQFVQAMASKGPRLIEAMLAGESALAGLFN